MPFTLSHPAAVLPLLRGVRGRGPLIASALVAGSMAPDVPYFAASLRPGAYRHGVLTHRWWAVPTVDVAIAGALVAGWYGVRVPLLALLPDRWAAAADAATAPSVRWPSRGEAAAFALSAAVGAATHVGCDAFTHQGRAGVRLLPALNREVAGVPLCTVLQYGMSALALGGLGRYLARELPPSQGLPPRAVGGRSAGRRLLGLAAALGAAHRVARSTQVRGPGQPRSPIEDVCFGAGAGTAAGAVLLAAARHLADPPR
ncbi:hypothetical protein P3T37_005855 [Kitasatospora sp. MAA4]|uniref:DUF4184 family protein n=1 Tax=Kitasatospora sp. MAA4 TaxID=3035093 RepID=UPI002473A296|nr:DUF4184 family protein [Kitasatospora sp. MAA4]MDH6136427.1 hypothetical protein [Kitasatospora sp. MAA4]